VPEFPVLDNPSSDLQRQTLLPPRPLSPPFPPVMALGSQAYPRNPQLLAPPFTQSPPQSSTDLVWPDEPVRAVLLSDRLPYVSNLFLYLSSYRLRPSFSPHLPQSPPNLLALAAKYHPFPHRGIKVAGPPGQLSPIVLKTMQVSRVAQLAMATGSLGNPNPL
jgi:hypothetical protein